MGHYDPSSAKRKVIESRLPNEVRGKKRVGDRRFPNGTYWVLRSGSPSADAPERDSPHTTLNNRWREAGHWDRLKDAIVFDHAGDVQVLDIFIVRIHRQGATAKRRLAIDVWVVRVAASQRKSTRPSISKADRSS